MKPEKAPKIRYIKLGEGGRWWKECHAHHYIRLGFDSGTDLVYEAARTGQWETIRQYWIDKGTGTPTHHTNQTREFFDDDGHTLWITFEGGCLHYAFTDGGDVNRFLKDPTDTSTFRKLDSDGWRHTDAKGKELRVDQLSGRLTKTAAYRQTICGFQKEVEDYLRLRLAGEVSPLVEETEKAKRALLHRMEAIVQSFTWQDFEVLIELIFAQSGLRRLSRTGGTKKTTDLDLENPITGELAFVQVKSQTSQSQLEEYVERRSLEKNNQKMYYVYHSSTGTIRSQTTDAVVWDVKEVAEKALAVGLLDWVISKAK